MKKYLIVFVMFVSGIGLAQVPVDTYGGVLSVTCPNTAPSDWNMQQMTIGAKTRKVFCTPLDHPFIKRAVYYIIDDPDHTSAQVPLTNATYILNKYGANDSSTFSNAAYSRIKSWGFNAGAPGAWRHAESTDVASANKVPFTEYIGTPMKTCIQTSNCKNIWNLQWPPNVAFDSGDHYIADAFDTDYATVTTSVFSTDTGLAAFKTSPFFMGGVGGDTDYYTTFAAGCNFTTDPAGKCWGHTVWYIAQSAPRQKVNRQNSYAVFSDSVNYTKQSFADFLQARYVTIGALNTAWGSSYSSFGTAGAAVAGTSLSGSGVGPWTGTLTRSTGVDRFSVTIKKDGVAVGGDDGFGGLHGPGIASGTVNYTSGAVSVTFTGSASAATSDYYHDGYGIGSGLLDEANNGHAWFPSDQYNLTGATTAFKTDFDDYLTIYSHKLFGVMADAFHVIAPTKLFFGISNIGGWRAPGRCNQMKGAAEVVDVVQIGGFDGSQAQANFIGTCTGDKPFTTWESATANPESDWYNVAVAEPGTWNLGIQADRGAFIQTDMSNYWSVCNTGSGICSWVGYDFWAYYSWSYPQFENFGLVSWRDNAFDGVEAVSGTVKCSAPINTFNCGGEHGNYGNFLGPVKAANFGFDSLLSSTPASNPPTLTPSSFLFSNTLVGSSQSTTFVLANNTASNVSITSQTVTGTSFSRNSGSSTCVNAMVLSPNAQCAIVVTFTPGSAASFSGNLAVVLSTGTLNSSLSGTGLTAAPRAGKGKGQSKGKGAAKVKP